MERTPEERARKRAKAYNGLMWHIGTFVVVNAFLWFIDINGGGGLDWAYWTTIPWGVALGFHALSYFIDDSGMTQRKYEKFLDAERRRDLQDH
ncbi:MAG: 2TM domain-containing protein [Acidimicrobiia bacterium]|nr:2TM domain-containing protein [Acidimicrobiia bacterium]NNC74127.1 2TM domain-containing protein [Acidimicrobiia bacterium]NNK91196.1 2TM domain-containing protein [Acidimicrobiia bacterium]